MESPSIGLSDQVATTTTDPISHWLQVYLVLLDELHGEIVHDDLVSGAPAVQGLLGIINSREANQLIDTITRGDAAHLHGIELFELA